MDRSIWIIIVTDANSDTNTSTHIIPMYVNVIRHAQPILAVGVAHLDTLTSPDGNLRTELTPVLRSPHQQQPRQHVEEELSYPWRHDVSARSSEVHVQHEHGDDDRARDQHHGEEEIFADEWRGERCRRIDLSDQQQEDVEGVQDCYAHGDLLPRVSRDVEDEQCDGTDGDAWKDQVDGVEEGLATDRDVELDIRIWFGTTRIVLEVLLCRDGEQIPFRTFVVVVEIDAILHLHGVFFIVS